MPDLHLLRDATILLGGKIATSLRLELKFVALRDGELEVKFADGLCHVVGKGKDDVDSVLIARCSSGYHLNLHICVAHNSLVFLGLAWLWG